MKNLPILFLLTAFAIVGRLLPHAPNFTPIVALAIFSARYFKSPWISAAMVVLSMIMSDGIIGFHSGMPFVYLSLMMVGVWAFYTRKHQGLGSSTGITLVGSSIFFASSNFFVWLTSNMYPHTLEGFIACYASAIPFFHNTALSSLFYMALISVTVGAAARQLEPSPSY